MSLSDSSCPEHRAKESHNDWTTTRGSPHEPDGFSAFHEACAQCPPYRAVIEWCLDQHARGHSILIVTGRDAWTRALTEQWLSEHLPVPIDGLHMRPDGDFRSNRHVKREIHSQLALTYEIRAAIDDDPEIVELWQGLGIPVAMVLDWGQVVLLRPDEHEQ